MKPGSATFGLASAAVVLVLAASTNPLAAQIPTPESVLGHRVGADFHLATFEESIDYFARLDAATDRLELREVGRSSFGRPVYIALISSAENLRNLDRHREIAMRLAHPEGLTDAEARALADEGRALVHIDGGLHATEVAHAQHTIQLAYDLVTGDNDPEIRAILDNVILMLWPSINPDGQTMVAEWYRSNVGTPFEVASTPFLYQKYIGHDNNRDGYMINQIESRMATRVVREWEPQILYNHHQSSPFPTRIWIPPFAEPISPHVHPLMWRTVNLIGMAMSQALEERGQKGATHMGTGFDNWYPGFIDHANNFHNVASFLTETGLYRYATPHFYTIQDFPARTRDLRPQSLYSSPWEGGWWRLRDAVDYMLTASVSVLDFAAKYRRDVLYNRYQAGRDVIAEYTEGPPYAYFVPADQDDPVAAVEMLRRLAFNGIEVHQLDEAVTFEGVSHPAGTWVIVMDQPFANFVRQLFAVQDYPDLRQYPEGPPDQPYDVAGWTLPYLMGVRVVEAASPLGDEVRGAMSWAERAVTVRGARIPEERALLPRARAPPCSPGTPTSTTRPPSIRPRESASTAIPWPPPSCLRREAMRAAAPSSSIQPKTTPSRRSTRHGPRAARSGSYRVRRARTAPPAPPGAMRSPDCRGVPVVRWCPACTSSRPREHRRRRAARAAFECRSPGSVSTGPGIRRWTKGGRAGCSRCSTSTSRAFTTPTSWPAACGTGTT